MGLVTTEEYAQGKNLQFKVLDIDTMVDTSDDIQKAGLLSTAISMRFREAINV